MTYKLSDNALIKHKLTILKNKKTGTKEFREIVKEISILLTYEVMKNSKLNEIDIETPVSNSKGYLLNEDKYAFIPILRAGLGMVDGVTQVIPNAKIGHIGLYRDEETLKPIKYYYKVPKDIKKREVILIDPMLATGGSASAAVEMLKKDGVKNIKFMCIIAAPEGIKKLLIDHPEIEIYTAEVDEYLNQNGYITPGLGDAGDRIFGTK